MDKELKRFMALAYRLQAGGRPLDDEELEFFAGHLPQVNNERLIEIEAEVSRLRAEGKLPDKTLNGEMMVLNAQKLLQSPENRTRLLELSRKADAAGRTSKIAEGVNLLLAGADILQSNKQIKAAERASAKSKRPTRPVSQRDLMLQQALRGAELGTMNSERAIAPVRAEIQDQYLTDMSNAQTASAGQSGAYGAYAQLASDRRNRAAMNLAPIADQVRSREQQRYDNLLQARANEGQQVFQNNAQFYPYDLQQYNLDQQAAGQLGAQGRMNLRNSYGNLGNIAANSIGNRTIQRKYKKLDSKQIQDKYRKLYDQIGMYSSDAADIAVKGAQYLEEQTGFDPDLDSRLIYKNSRVA
jgi:hypothetical protein